VIRKRVLCILSCHGFIRQLIPSIWNLYKIFWMYQNQILEHNWQFW
jgi:hypothetical protein